MLNNPLRALCIIASETFTLLRRDRIFVPALICGLCIAAFANLASEWSVEDFSKILFDVGFFGFQFTGGIVALFWGTKALNDSRQEGALEVQLAAPIGRSTWLLGKYLGLALCLGLFGLLLLAFWQVMMLLNQFGRMTPPELWGFSRMVMGWWVLAALAILLASMMGQALALFAGVCLWIAGLISAEVVATMPKGIDPNLQRTAETISRFWDLRQFSGHLPALQAQTVWHWSMAYGAILILLLLSFAAIAFQRRDISA